MGASISAAKDITYIAVAVSAKARGKKKNISNFQAAALLKKCSLKFGGMPHANQMNQNTCKKMKKPYAKISIPKHFFKQKKNL